MDQLFLREALDPKILDSERINENMPPKRYINICAWGDLLFHLWHHKHGPKPSEWYVISSFPDMERFLRAQPDITYAKHFYTDIPVADYGPHLGPEWNKLGAPEQARLFASMVGLPRRLDIELPGQTITNPGTPWHGAVLPQEESNWARETVELVRRFNPGKRVVLVHPYSFHHLKLEYHWPHIQKAWNWLLENTDDILLLTGLPSPLRPKLPLPFPLKRTYDFVGQLPTAIHLFALAQECDLTLTTSNCLSCWLDIQDLPGIAWIDKETCRENVFWSWHTYSHHVFWDDPLDKFIKIYKSFPMDRLFIDAVVNGRDNCTRRFAWLHYGLVHAIRPKVIVETGTATGYITAFLAAAAKETGADLYSIDITEDLSEAARYLRSCGVYQHVKLISGQSSVPAIEQLGKEGKLKDLGLVVLDSDHSYEHITAEIAIIWPYLKEGGLIGSHDTMLRDYSYITRAMQDAAVTYNAKDFWFPGSHGFTYIQKPFSQGLELLGVGDGAISSFSEKLS